jgi:1,4-alpha-glucan branching enzyme
MKKEPGKRTVKRSRKTTAAPKPRASKALAADDLPPTVSDLDRHLFGEGKHEEIYKKLGAHVTKLGRTKGVAFAVWAPHAASVSVVGDFNAWDANAHRMRLLGNSGVWELFIPKLEPGMLYKFQIRSASGFTFLKADPYAQHAETPPDTSSIIYESKYKFRDAKWMNARVGREHFRKPLSIYEVHFGSWRRKIEEENRPFTYREMAEPLAAYVKEMGFTHVEFLPLKEHPY